MEIESLSVKSLLHRRLFSFAMLSLLLASGLHRCMGDRIDPDAPSPVLFTVGSFSFQRPQGWVWVIPQSAIRKAEFSIPSQAQGEDPVTVTFFCFGRGEGGSVQANVNRWTAQFANSDGSPSKAVTESKVFDSVPVTIVTATGFFSGGMGQSTSVKPLHAGLRGAILQSPQGDVYVKMTGPETLVRKSSQSFDDMIREACSGINPR
jgi:hypothetical protein